MNTVSFSFAGKRNKSGFNKFFKSEDLKYICDVHSKTPHSITQLINETGFFPPLNGHF